MRVSTVLPKGPLERAIDLVCLLTKNLNLPKGRAHKLLSIYTGPYYITSSNVSVSNYALDLPGEPRARNIYAPNLLHAILRPHTQNSDEKFLDKGVHAYYGLIFDKMLMSNGIWMRSILD